jgi:hypothetical protein
VSILARFNEASVFIPNHAHLVQMQEMKCLDLQAIIWHSLYVENAKQDARLIIATIFIGMSQKTGIRLKEHLA